MLHQNIATNRGIKILFFLITDTVPNWHEDFLTLFFKDAVLEE
jgi:hypothetical protein